MGSKIGGPVSSESDEEVEQEEWLLFLPLGLAGVVGWVEGGGEAILSKPCSRSW